MYYNTSTMHNAIVYGKTWKTSILFKFVKGTIKRHLNKLYTNSKSDPIFCIWTQYALKLKCELSRGARASAVNLWNGRRSVRHLGKQYIKHYFSITQQSLRNNIFQLSFYNIKSSPIPFKIIWNPVRTILR